jgi:SAM-dependent methyltransferase
VTDQYSRHAAAWSDEAYADSETYLRRRAELVAALGEPLQLGDAVCDLACGDGGLGAFLLRRGLRYVGVDLNDEMVAAARRRLQGRAQIVRADLNDFIPEEHVAATTVFRAIYYARDHAELFRHLATYTDTKVVFDLNPRQYDVDDMLAYVRSAGFERVELRPFFIPQRHAFPRPVAALARAAERSGPLARLALRYRFTYMVSASR